MKPALKLLLWLATVFGAVIIFNGCAKPAGVLTAPPPDHINVQLETISSLRPKFEWSPVVAPNATYDLIVCLGVSNSIGCWSPGKTVYYRSRLTNSSHTVAEPLAPDTIYVWSVRAHSGTRASKWASYGDDHPDIFQASNHHEVMYPFKTPAN